MTSELLPRINWQIHSVREPDRFLVFCHCPHGQVSEYLATWRGGIVDVDDIVQTTANNLLRRSGCDCSILAPPLDPGQPTSLLSVVVDEP